MKTKVLSATQIVPIRTYLLPDGEYNGLWGGYQVEVTINGKDYILDTDDGIRGINVPCIVTINGAYVVVEAE